MAGGDSEGPPPYVEPSAGPRPPPRRRGGRFNAYCLQVSFCILFIWVVISNVILYFVFPEDLPKYSEHNQGSRQAEEQPEVLFQTLHGAIKTFMRELSSAAPSYDFHVIQEGMLEHAKELESGTFNWDLIAGQPSQFVLTLVSVGKLLPNCEIIRNIARGIGGANVFCRPDRTHALIQSMAAMFHLVSATREGDYLKIMPLNDSSTSEQLSALDITSSRKGSSKILFLNDISIFSAPALGDFAPRLLDDIHLNLPLSPKDFLRQLDFSKFVPCDQSAAEEFFEMNPEMHRISQSAEAADFRVVSRQILKQVAEAFASLDIPFWISSGTFLGWLRQCDAIPYSGDVDIGVFIKDWDEELILAMEEAGFQLKMELGKIEDSLQYSFLAKDMKLDVYFFYEDGDKVWNGATKPETGEKFKYVFPAFKLCWTHHFDLTVRVPCPSIPYAEANYGKDWRVPQRNWDWRESPPNSVPNGAWTKDDDAVHVFDHFSLAKEKEL